MRRGCDTVTFIKDTDSGVVDRQGNPVIDEVLTDMPNCWVQPMSVHDQVSQTVYSNATHRVIAPPAGAGP
jgi:hypothetical protein